MKKIVLDGFKSFYTRTEIDFSDDITCIVGPNGCGKSNILDAVRWVLGEQSAKQLRGQEISDLISAGNARRTGKNKAEAHLTFADVQKQLDTDRDEIEVGRIVDQDGKGTYLLNGDEVRLKDVQDLFRDTGIGQDLYSIIGQGEVVRLIESKPEERREIIEEAAGIATFRHRRDLSKRRLEQTREELETVEKELREKQGRLSQLKGQAKEAETVQNLQKELRECRFEKRRREYVRVEEKIDELRTKKEEARDKFEAAKENKEQNRDRLEKFEDNLNDIKHRITRLESNLRPINKQHQQTREELGRIQTRKESLKTQIKRDRADLKRHLNDRADVLDRLVERYRERYETKLSARVKGEAVDVLEEKERAVKSKTQQLRDELEGIRSRSLFEISEESEINHRLKAAREDAEEIRDNRRSIEEQLSEHRRRMDRSRSESGHYFQQLIEAETEKIRLGLKKRYSDLEAQSLETLKNDLKQSTIRVGQRLDSLSSREDTLKQFMDNYEGFYPGVQSIMNRSNGQVPDDAGWSESLKGVLANLISVESEYETAIERVLERDVQSIVVEDRASARSMIQFLNDQQSGRARFLPVELFGGSNGRVLPDPCSEVEGIRHATEVVSTTNGVGRIVNQLLDRVVVVDDFDTADHLLDELSDRTKDWTVVTVDGQIVRTDGALSGGTSDTDGSELINRDEELGDLREDIKQLRRTEDNLEFSKRRAGAMMDEVRERLERVGNALQGIESEITSHRRSFEEASKTYRESKNRFDNLSIRLADVIETSLKNEVHRAGLDVVQSTVSNRESNRQQRSDVIRRQLQVAENRLDGLQKQVRDNVREFEEMSSRRRELDNRLEESTERIRSNRRDFESTLSDLEQTRETLLETDVSHTLKQLELNRLESESDVLESLKSHWTEKENSYQDQLRSLNREVQDAERATEKMRGKYERYDKELENERARLEEIVETLREDHDLDPEEQEVEFDDSGKLPDYEWDELTEKIRELQEEIRSLQPVNMLAQKELEGLEEEVSSVREQKDDLVESCEKLERMIRRLNDRARSQFKEAFEEIQGYFENFAAELFNGGEGYLELTDDPILDAGVTLEIQPPGEKLKSMAALSGGEKTLTALAFLFALFERKATPFAFLDEVDAPFDDDNVAQFIKLLKRYGDRTQFVIITHNKATMQAASQLYGVTMEESGVSSLVSVELEEAQSLGEQPQRATS